MENLVAGYPGRVLVRNLFLCLPAPAFVAVVGHNGSGKTTLFRVLTGQLPYQGSVQAAGAGSARPAPRRQAGLLGYLPQRGSIGFAIAVRELVVMGRYRHHGLLSAYAPADYALADAALARVGMAHLAGRDFTQLSGRRAAAGVAGPAQPAGCRRCTCSTSPPSSSMCTTAARCSA